MEKHLTSIYLINLNRSPERLEFMQQQLQPMNIAIKRIEAIDGAQLDENILAKYRQQSKQSYLHYNPLNQGEIGCAMSWHKVWHSITNQEQKAVVALEDDVQLGDNFLTTITALLNKIDENIIIDLSGKKGTNIVENKTINGIKLIRYQTPPVRNQGKIYGKKAVNIFLNKIQHFKAPVDTLQQMIWIHNVKIWSLEIGCLSHQDKTVSGSTIIRKNQY